MKLTDFIKPDYDPKNLVTDVSPEEILAVLKDFKILSRAMYIVDNAKKTGEIDFLPKDLFQDLVRVIDSVFHKRSIVERTMLLYMSAKAILSSSKKRFENSIALDIISEKLPDIIEKVNKIEDEKRRAKNN